MVKDFSQSALCIKFSKTGHHIPVINDVHLHSAYNPIKEAEAFFEKNIESIKGKNKLLILGLGFAYHINQIIKFMDDYYKGDFKIAVVEPHFELASMCLEKNLLNDSRVVVFSKRKASELYQINEFVDFLISGPNILTHSASFNLHETFFRELLSYKAPSTIKHIVNLIHQPDLKKYFEGLDLNQDLNLISEENLKTQLNQPIDFLILAFSHITSSKTKELGT